MNHQSSIGIGIGMNLSLVSVSVWRYRWNTNVYKRKGLTKASGTRTCHHLHYGPNNTINKPEVEILALPCDGEEECAGGVDEMCDPLLTRVQLCE